VDFDPTFESYSDWNSVCYGTSVMKRFRDTIDSEQYNKTDRSKGNGSVQAYKAYHAAMISRQQLKPEHHEHWATAV